MEITKIAPAVLYDNRCSSCSSFARLADRASGRRLSMIGHYTKLGQEIGAMIGDDATEMFWVIDGGYARGGRAGLGALAQLTLKRTSRASERVTADSDICDDTCGGPRAVMYRSCSVLTHSRTMHLY